MYVGKTNNPSERWINHKYVSKKAKTKLYNAMRSYGVENFEMILVESDASEEFIYEREIYWIALLDTVNNGYNIAIGGRGRHSTVTSEQMDQIHKLYAQESMTLSKISDVVGIPAGTIFKYLQNDGVVVPRQKEFSEEDVQKMIELRDAGYGPKRIGIMFDVSRQTIDRTLNRTGIENPRALKLTLKQLSEEEITELIELRKKGVRFQELEKRFGIPFRKIKKILQAADADIFISTKKIKENQFPEIIELFKQGATQNEIAEKYGVCSITLSDILKDVRRGARPNPKSGERHIYLTERGIRVKILTGTKKFYRDCKTMEEAIAVRDEFLKQYPTE